jgi:nucleotide-binding universal stress UspA family protein
MFQSIMVPLDGSKLAECSLPYVESIIEAGNVKKVSLVKVVEPVHIPGYAGPVYDINHGDDVLIAKDVGEVGQEFEAAAKSDAKAYLEQIGRITFSDVTVQTDVVVGNVAESLAEYAQNHDINLIAMATHGRSGISRWMMGSTANKILRSSSVPVLMIRALAADLTIKQHKTIKKILLPLDGSDVGETAILYAEALARELNAELVLFQALHRTRMAPAEINEPEEVIKGAAITYLKNIENEQKEKGLESSSMVDDRFGSPADHILDFAEANDIDLIAMSTHGRSGIGRWVFGGVTDKVLHAGHTALLVVRASDK